MKIENHDDTREFWDLTASDWHIQVGLDGDVNRRLNSDPVLWKFAGDINGLTVLDAGCGTGYLSLKLADKGANVTGVDFSPKMIQIALENSKSSGHDISFLVDSCSNLKSIKDNQFDLIVCNYVLMDLPDLKGAISSFYRVLKEKAAAVLIFSHPAFPQGKSTKIGNRNRISYQWDFSYFENKRCTDPPWAHFKNDFIWFHRPLSDYWKIFKSAGFEITDFDEPRLTLTNKGTMIDPEKLNNCQTRPYSVAFKLNKQ
jgi:ubiquinone/menaquinone biosynthesis C-methylase UbiE